MLGSNSCTHSLQERFILPTQPDLAAAVHLPWPITFFTLLSVLPNSHQPNPPWFMSDMKTLCGDLHATPTPRNRLPSTRSKHHCPPTLCQGRDPHSATPSSASLNLVPEKPSESPMSPALPIRYGTLDSVVRVSRSTPSPISGIPSYLRLSSGAL